ncbi:hypothetical protein GCM10010430_59940 [Kitasatospora cystarginea]|uniref:Uncharacterized protein n=1 Tax=Kitasatospora cystarginea TaxID=58350 RepID=A0ABN3ERF9_9ACTN
MQLTTEGRRRRQEIVRPGRHSWGIWLSDHQGGKVFIENLTRAERRRSVLSQIAEDRRQHRAKGLR